MGHRISKVYTRTGDQGQTGLGDGQRVDKDHARITAMGDIDELNSHLGLLVALNPPAPLKNQLLKIQHHLFDLGGEISIPGSVILGINQVQFLEKILDDYNQGLPPLKEFILPGGMPGAAQCHVARSVCRRAERHLFSLKKTDNISEMALIYLNRLGDFLFVAARFLNSHHGIPEFYWQKDD